MKVRKQSKKWMWGSFGVLLALLILSVVGMKVAVRQTAETAISKTASAVLASAGIEDEENVSLTVSYFDQKQDTCVNLYSESARAELFAREFEWASCGYYHQEIESGMADFYLDDGKIQLSSGKLTSNRGISSRWFSAVEGKSREYSGKLALEYAADGAEFTFSSDEFYPLDDKDFSAGDEVNEDGHNHLFTMSLSVPFMVAASGEESFEIFADDDTFVYVGEKLALDMGGIHTAESARFSINEKGEVYAAVGEEELAYSGITLEEGESAAVRIFHADRDSGTGSEFSVRFSGMKLNVVSSQVAEGAAEIAYSGDGYVAPLGESLVVQADSSRAYLITMTVLGVAVIAFSMFVGLVVGKMI